MKSIDVIKHWADAWRSLSAWGAMLPMQIEVIPDKGRGPLGKAWSYKCMAMVYDTGDLAGNLKTVLHELAHLAAPDAIHHGMAWRKMFARGAAEALNTKLDTFELDVDQYTLGAQVEDAVRAWLDRTGQSVVLRAIGVL